MFRKIALVTYRKDFEWRETERKTNKQKQKTAKLWLQSEGMWANQGLDENLMEETQCELRSICPKPTILLFTHLSRVTGTRKDPGDHQLHNFKFLHQRPEGPRAEQAANQNFLWNRRFYISSNPYFLLLCIAFVLVWNYCLKCLPNSSSLLKAIKKLYYSKKRKENVCHVKVTIGIFYSNYTWTKKALLQLSKWAANQDLFKSPQRRVIIL